MSPHKAPDVGHEVQPSRGEIFEASIYRLGNIVESSLPDLRDRFAMAALSGVVAIDLDGEPLSDPDVTAKTAYAFADAMLRAREAGK